MTSDARKVWIFKMLLKKHGYKARLEKNFKRVAGQKIKFFNVLLDMQNGETHKLMVMTATDNNKKLLKTIEIPYKYNISYADVLDSILDTMKKKDSDCYISNFSFPPRIKIFLKKDISLEELNIELDLTYLNII